MVGWHHWLNGHKFEQTLGDTKGQGSLVSCSPWGCKELGMTEQLNNKLNLKWNTTAAAAKSLQSCPTLWNPIDGSPPGSPIRGILQARTLEWVAISQSPHNNGKESKILLMQIWYIFYCKGTLLILFIRRPVLQTGYEYVVLHVFLNLSLTHWTLECLLSPFSEWCVLSPFPFQCSLQ